MKQYRIIGRFANEEKFHRVDSDPNWTKADAERRLAEIKRDEENAKRHGGTYQQAGMIGVFTKWYPEYELVDVKIQSREVTSWQDV